MTLGTRVGPVSMDQLQKRIYGQRQEPLSSIELRELLVANVPIQELALYLEVALQREVLDPTNLLIHAIAKAVTQENLIPIAMALRYGANANTYVNVPGLGTMHVIPYVYRTLTSNNVTMNQGGTPDVPILNSVVIMLIASGSKPVMPAFDSGAGRVRQRNPDDEGLSSLEWLQTNGYDTIIPRIQNDFTAVDPNFLTRLGIYLNRIDLILEPLQPEHLTLILKNRINPLFERYLQENPTRVVNGLELAIDYLNAFVFERFLERGHQPSYLLMNNLLSRIRQYRSINDRLSARQLEEMLREAVRRGTPIDRDQFLLLSGIDRSFAEAIQREYQQPYWRKVCRSRSPDSTKPIGDRLQRISVAFGLDPTQSKVEICNALDRLAEADPERLLQAAIRRQQGRVSTDLANLNEYIGGTAPVLVCRNQAVTDTNPYEYNDLDLAYYRDTSNAVWCFTRDTFQNLLETKTNPYTLQALPESFQFQLQNRLDFARRLGLDSTNQSLIPFSQAIELLRQPDTIERTTEESTRYVETLVQTATIYGLSPEQVRNLTRTQMERLLQLLGINTLISTLAPSHAMVTFARLVQDRLREQPDLASLFFTNLATVVTLPTTDPVIVGTPGRSMTARNLTTATGP